MQRSWMMTELWASPTLFEVQGKVIQLLKQHETSPLSLSALMVGKVRSGVVLSKNILGGEEGGFCRGFCDFQVFCGGKNVVSLWWNAWWMWCFVRCCLGR